MSKKIYTSQVLDLGAKPTWTNTPTLTGKTLVNEY